jgi:hypothetical protein
MGVMKDSSNEFFLKAIAGSPLLVEAVGQLALRAEWRFLVGLEMPPSRPERA